MSTALRIAAAALFALGAWDLADGALLLAPSHTRGEREACTAVAELFRQTNRPPPDEDCTPPDPVHGVGWLVAAGVCLLFAQSIRRPAPPALVTEP